VAATVSCGILDSRDVSLMALDLKSLARRYLFDTEVVRLMGLVVLVKPFGLATQMLMANFFGAGPRYDAYALAFFMVTFFSAVIGNVFTAVVVPYTIKLRDRLPSPELFGFQNMVLILFLLPAVAYTLLLMLGTGTIVDVVGPGLPAETKAYTVRMIRLMALPGVMLLFGAMGKAVLNLNNRFRFAAGMPVLNAAIILLAVALFHGRLGIWSFALGFGVSNALQVVLLWGLVGVRRHAVPVAPFIPPGSLRKLWSLCWMLMMIHAIALVYQFIDKMFASSLEQGSISSIAYANTILIFGVELFALTLVVVMFTRMAELVSAGDLRGFSDYVLDKMERVSRLVLPATLLLFISSGEIVRVVFMRGAFTPADAERTAGALAMYVLGLPAYVLCQMTARAFNSLQRMREMIWLSLLYLVTNVGGNALLIGPYQVKGLAISSSVAVYLYLVMSLWVLHRYRIGLQVGRWTAVLLKYHLIVFGTYLIYEISGFGDLMEVWDVRGRVLGDMLIAACKAAYIFFVYGGLLLLWNVIVSGRKPAH